MLTNHFKEQKYGSLKKACLKKGELFQDTHFPANNKSLFYSRVDKDIEWKRPGELCKVPKLVVEGVTCDDLNEGELGNSWFVSACSALAKEPKLFNKVIPDVKAQEWSEQNQYAGIFRFQFWRYGRWLEVVVDDLLPTKNGKLIFCHSHSRNEFWSALLEKAYAKLYGDYESLEQGFTADALVDFTGGVPEKLILKDMNLSNKDKQDELFTSLLDAHENKALINCCIAGEANQGLIQGHGYILTDLRQIKVAKGLQGKLSGQAMLKLVRLRNPWGVKEWTGAWSDESQEWSALSLKDKQKMGLTFQQEGEFWMSFADFCTYFTNVDVCHFVNTSFFSIKKSWTESMLHGEWTTGAKGSSKDRSGGSDQFDTFLDNPQYLVDVTGEKDTIMMSLEQDDMHAGKGVGDEHKTIGIIILKTEENRRFRVQIPSEKVSVSEYKQSRSIFHKVTLVKGRYVFLPTTFKAGETCNFLLRVYTGSNSAKEPVMPLLKDFPTSSICSSPYAMVTRLNIQKAVGLQKKEGTKTMDAYVVVKCEGETVKCWPKKNTDSPVWELKCIFYRKKPAEKLITIEIYNSNLISDDYVGMATIEEIGSDNPEVKELDLYGKGKEGKGKEKESQKPGKLFVELKSSDDLTAF